MSFGSLWPPLGHLWGLLGVFGAVFGVSFGGLVATLGRSGSLRGLGVDFGSILEGLGMGFEPLWGGFGDGIWEDNYMIVF